MFSRKLRLTSFAFLVLLIASGASFGFLLGRNQQRKAQAQETVAQIQDVTQRVEHTGAVLMRGIEALQHLLTR